jgi:hypothetical protein
MILSKRSIYSNLGIQWTSIRFDPRKEYKNLNHSAKDWKKSSSSRDWETARPVDLIWNEDLW